MKCSFYMERTNFIFHIQTIGCKQRMFLTKKLNLFNAYYNYTIKK